MFWWLWVTASTVPVTAGDPGRPWPGCLCWIPNGAQGWSSNSLIWAKSGHLYLAISAAEAQAPYLRHGQIWTSSDKYRAGHSFEQRHLPISAMATGPSAGGSGEALYVGTYDDNESDDRVIVPRNLHMSRDHGASWSNLGAIPEGVAPLDAAANVPDQLSAGGQGVGSCRPGRRRRRHRTRRESC